MKFLVVKKDGKDLYSTVPSELYFVCDGAVYTMIASPARIPAQTVQLTPGKAGTARKNIELYGELPFEKKIITIVKRVYMNDVPDSFTKTVVGRKMDLFKDLEVILRATYAIEGEGLRVKEFEVRIMPTSTVQSVSYKENDFLRTEVSLHPVAVSVESMSLEEGRNVARLRGGTDRRRTAMKEKLVKIWGTLRPEQRKKSIIAGVLLVLTIIAFGLYKSTRGSAPPPPPSAKREINLGAGDKDVLEKSLYNESTKVIDDMKTQMEDLQKQLEGGPGDKGGPVAPCARPAPLRRVCPVLWGRRRGTRFSRLPCRQLAHPRRLSLRAFRRRHHWRNSPVSALPFPAPSQLLPSRRSTGVSGSSPRLRMMRRTMLKKKTG